MSSTPDWGHGDQDEPKSAGIPIFAVIAWIASIVVMADLLFVAQRYMG